MDARSRKPGPARPWNRTGTPGVRLLVRALATLLATAALLSCRSEARTDAPPIVSHAPVLSAQAPSAAPAVSQQAEPLAPRPAMSDAELGELITRLSETPGDFPSDNLVSNETSYLDVATQLRSPSLAGKAYVGVGPEQNLTYVSILDPPIAYIVDIRRGNLLEHMVLRACIEAADSRVQFVSALTARPVPAGLAEQPAQALVGDIVEQFGRTAGEPALRERAAERTRALMGRLGLRTSGADDKAVRAIHQEFYRQGLGLAYTMEGSGRKYPGIGSLLAQSAPDGTAASFLGSEEAYQRLRRLMGENRLVPVVGDFLGEKALVSIGRDLRGRGLTLGVFYTSNVEQYLFADGKYGKFVSNVASMPLDDASLMVRVWFDQGRAHPRQQAGHRTTTLTMPAAGFVQRAGQRPWRSYWEVATEGS
jgi:hypothetical protein